MKKIKMNKNQDEKDLNNALKSDKVKNKFKELYILISNIKNKEKDVTPIYGSEEVL
jgi:hypothetical protein